MEEIIPEYELYTRPFEWLRYDEIERVYGSFLDGGDLYISEEKDQPHDSDGLEVIGYKASGARAYPMRASDLPNEFFNHQLLSFDSNSEEDIHTFLSEWGMLFSPSREKPRCFEGNWPAEVEAKDVAAKKMTDQLREHFAKNGVLCDTVSLPEAGITLHVLQDVVADMMSIFKNECSSYNGVCRITSILDTATIPPLEIVGSWAGVSPTIFPERGLRSYGLLVSAICNQMLDTIDDPVEWRLCACDGCGRLFKRKQTKSQTHDKDSKYCCDPCMERQKKRNQRAAAKNRIRH